MNLRLSAVFFRDRRLHLIGIGVFCAGVGLIVIGLILCCCWMKEADSSRKIRQRRESTAFKMRPRFGSKIHINHALLTVPTCLVSIVH